MHPANGWPYPPGHPVAVRAGHVLGGSATEIPESIRKFIEHQLRCGPASSPVPRARVNLDDATSQYETIGDSGGRRCDAGGLSCTGQIRMTFTDSGTFSRSGAVRCTVGSTTRRGGVASAGRYSTNGDQLVIEGTRSTGTTPDSWGDATATYAVTGDTLTIQFTQGSVGTITQTYQRVG